MALSVEQKTALLKSHNFHLVTRDPMVKAGHAGEWMIKGVLDNSPDQWAVTGDDIQVLLDDAIDAHELTHYMVGHWEHIFHDNAPASQCRIVLDRVAQAVIYAQVKLENSWRSLGKDDRADLLESMNDNDVWSSIDMQEGLDKTNELPSWALG